MKKLGAAVKLPAEINKFVAVTNDPEFRLETALLFNDTHNTGHMGNPNCIIMFYYVISVIVVFLTAIYM